MSIGLNLLHQSREIHADKAIKKPAANYPVDEGNGNDLNLETLQSKPVGGFAKVCWLSNGIDNLHTFKETLTPKLKVFIPHSFD
jgi:hypothetical protein